MHMAVARLGCERAVVGTGWTNSCSGCINRLRKHHSHHVEGSFLAGKAPWVLNGCLPVKNAFYCTLINEWAWLRSRVHSFYLKVHLGSGLESELRQK